VTVGAQPTGDSLPTGDSDRQIATATPAINQRFEADASCDHRCCGPRIQFRAASRAATTELGECHEHYLHDEDRTSSAGGRIASQGGHRVGPLGGQSLHTGHAGQDTNRRQ
jgi:hypothetical protein